MASAGSEAVLLEIDRDLVDLDRLEASDGKVQALLDEELGKLRKLDVKALPVPARIFGDLVVCQEQCALLGLAQPFEHDHRHLVKVEINRGRMATMPQQDCVLLIDYQRDHEAEGNNAIGDLADLLFRMRPRITLIGFERMRRNPLDLMHNELLSRAQIGTHKGIPA